MLRGYAIEAGALRALPMGPAGGIAPSAVWIDLVAPSPEEERAIEDALGIGIPTRAEAGGLQISDRLAVRDGAFYMSALVPTGADPARPLVPVTFVRTGERLITVRYSSVDSLDPFIARQSSGEAALGGAGDLFAALLETIVDRIAERLEQVGTALGHLSHGIFHHQTALARRTGRHLSVDRRTRRLQAMIEELGTQHEITAMLRQCLQSLLRLAAFSKEHADDGLRRRLKAIETDLHSVAEHNTALAAEMEFMLDATVGLIGIQQNKVIYILSIVGVVLTPPVLVASIYGMNFHNMPELGWRYGYGWGLGLMLVSAVGPFLIFKFRGWL